MRGLFRSARALMIGGNRSDTPGTSEDVPGQVGPPFQAVFRVPGMS